MTTEVEFFAPSDAVDPTKVRRSKTGRPYVKQPCPSHQIDTALDKRDWYWRGEPWLCFDGRVQGARPGTTKQCPKCKGNGFIEKLYHRCTSFVSVLDDRSSLEKWKLRIVLTGLGVDAGLLESLERTDPDDTTMLDAIAAEAFEIGEGHAKAQKGTDLHTLTEYVDKGWDLPASLTDYDTGQERPVTLQDRADLAAWQRAMSDLHAVTEGMERFVVQDEYEIGGTYDRLVSFTHERGGVTDYSPCFACGNKPLILDLKTGRIDYGAGKIAQQLAVYANSRDYDPVTGVRSDQDVCTHFGIVVHLPQGTGDATVHVVDLVAGWEAVKLSSQVREHRLMSKNMLWPLETHVEKVE